MLSMHNRNLFVFLCCLKLHCVCEWELCWGDYVYIT